MAKLQLLNHSCGVQFASPIGYVQIDVIRTLPNQKILPAGGFSDVINGVLVTPSSVKYPSLMYLRFRDADKKIVGQEYKVEFPSVKLYAPTPDCYGVEVYVSTGTVFNLTTGDSATMVDLTNYYTKAEIDALLANKANTADVYPKSYIDSFKNDTDSSIASLFDTVNSAPSFISYAQVAPPTTPGEGIIWNEQQEVTVSGITQNVYGQLWIYHSGQWQSLERYKLTQELTNLSGANTETLGSPLYKGYSILLEQLDLFYEADGLTTADYWTYQLQVIDPSNNYTSVGLQINSSAKTNKIWYTSTQALNLTYTASQIVALAIKADRQNSPYSTNYTANLYYRYIRP